MPQISPITWTLLVTFLILTMFIISSTLPTYGIFINNNTNVSSKEKDFIW